MSKKARRLDPPFRPYLCEEAVLVLEALLEPHHWVFEWGSGMSTLWLAERVSVVVSVEHAVDWLEEVTAALERNGLDASVRLVPGDEYALEIDVFPDERFDVVLVDGLDWTRPDCIAAGVDKVKAGGWLVIDDVNWHKLEKAVKPLRVWPHIEAAGYKIARDGKKEIRTKTGFFRKA